MERNRRSRQSQIRTKLSRNQKPVRYHRSMDQLKQRLNPRHTDAVRIQFDFSQEGQNRVLERSVENLQQDLQLFRLEDDHRSSFERFLKRSIDVIGALLGMLLLSPVFLLITLAIWRSAPGAPIVFSQNRVGKGGQLFRIYKFRTMIPDAEQKKHLVIDQNETGGPTFKARNEPRVTPVGRFLRKTSLDELPQLYNILKGDMSIVGPRPAIPEEVLSWKMWQTRRLSVDQGLTCIWQISGRSLIQFDRWMELDLEYIDSWSIWLDMRIILKTIWVVLTGKGAY